MNQTIYR